MNDIQTKSHAASKSQFSKLFVRTGKFDIKYGKLYSELFDWRQKGDYENILTKIETLYSHYLNQLKK